MTAIIVRCSISRRYEDEASILVRAHRCPTVGAAGRITLSFGRCAATVGMADVEGPRQPASDSINGPYPAIVFSAQIPGRPPTTKGRSPAPHVWSPQDETQ